MTMAFCPVSASHLPSGFSAQTSAYSFLPLRGLVVSRRRCFFLEARAVFLISARFLKWLVRSWAPDSKRPPLLSTIGGVRIVVVSLNEAQDHRRRRILRPVLGRG